MPRSDCDRIFFYYGFNIVVFKIIQESYGVYFKKNEQKIGCLVRHRANFINSAAMIIQLSESPLKMRFFGRNYPVMVNKYPFKKINV